VEEKAEKQVFDFLYELIWWCRGKLKEAIDKQDWNEVWQVYKRLEDEIGYK